MQIIKKKEGDSLIIALTDELDTTSAPELEAVLSSDLNGVTKLVFDFEKLNYLSSAGLRVLLKAQKTMAKQGSMVIKHVNDVIMDVFDMTGFSTILTIEEQ